MLDEGDRPEREPTEALNILLMGADNPTRLVEKPTIAELLAKGEWDAGAYRSDTVMVMHVPADRSAAYVVSIPRDSLVTIYDETGDPHGENKVNDAFSAYGPFGTWRTIENLSGLRLDHMAIIDYGGFKDLTTAIGGVDVYVPESVYDSQQDQQWDQGWVHLEDELALKYVRMRYGLLNGDFDRVARQQNFLRAVLQKTLSSGTVGNPVKFTRTLEAVVRQPHRRRELDQRRAAQPGARPARSGDQRRAVRDAPVRAVRAGPGARLDQHHRRAALGRALDRDAPRQDRGLPREVPRGRAARAAPGQLTPSRASRPNRGEIRPSRVSFRN